MKRIITTGLLCFVIAFGAEAQKLSQEKMVELTGKSKRKGYLGNVVVDDTKQQFDMVFVTKDVKRKVKYEVYQFDYDFNLVNNFEDEQRKPKGKRSKNKVYKGDYWQVTGVTASSNMTWDTSENHLIVNDSRLFIDQDDNVTCLYIDSESTTLNIDSFESMES